MHVPRVLELGCGACPVAGITARSLGCDVLFTDLKPLIPLIEANIRLNGSTVEAIREQTADFRGLISNMTCSMSTGGARVYQAALSRQSCDTEELVFGEALPSRALSLARSAWYCVLTVSLGRICMLHWQ